ncbi:MAG: hypothetical protein LBJ10_11430 [Clostridiales bacterium]|jgi:hypothetical protein|nr:hypothetical protein [Clostridiales bacterium]
MVVGHLAVAEDFEPIQEVARLLSGYHRHITRSSSQPAEWHFFGDGFGLQ